MSLLFVTSVETETRLVCTRSELSDLAFVLVGAAGYGLISHAVSPDTGEAVAKGEVKQSSFVLYLFSRIDVKEQHLHAGKLPLLTCCALALVSGVYSACTVEYTNRGSHYLGPSSICHFSHKLQKLYIKQDRLCTHNETLRARPSNLCCSGKLVSIRVQLKRDGTR